MASLVGVADIVDDRRHAQMCAVAALYGEEREQGPKTAAILASPERLVDLRSAGSRLRRTPQLLGALIFGGGEGQILADRLGGRISEERLRTCIPFGDATVLIDGNDAVGARFHYGRQTGQILFRLSSPGDVASHRVDAPRGRVRHRVPLQPAVPTIGGPESILE